MSKIMLHGVLNCPVNVEDPLSVLQLSNRAKQASELIYKQDDILEKINAVVWEKFMVKAKNPTHEDALQILALLEEWAANIE